MVWRALVVGLALLALAAWALRDHCPWTYLLCLRLGTLRDLQAIEITWRGCSLGRWEDAARLREFRASLPRYVEEMGCSSCGDESVTMLHLCTASRTTDLVLPVDDCLVINGRDYCFRAKATLRLLSIWITGSPAGMEAAGKRYGNDRQYTWLKGQLRHWSTPE